MKLGMLAVIPLFITLIPTVPVNAWWNESWQYRKLITIQENSGFNLTDYQVKLFINTSSLISTGKMNPDCSDVRFTYENLTGEYEIPYGIENGCNTTSTIIWVKVPEILANSNVTVYMYYGNPNAINKSNLREVFYAYDDCEYADSPLNHGWWVLVSGGATFETGTKYVHSGNYACHYSKPRGVPKSAYGMNFSSPLEKIISNPYILVEDYSLCENVGGRCDYGALDIAGWGVLYGEISYRERPGYFDEVGIRQYDKGKGYGVVIGRGYSYNTWYLNRMLIDAKIFGWGGRGYSGTLKNNVPIDGKAWLGFRSDFAVNQANSYWFDDFKVRAYTSPEPTYTIGAEETLPVPKPVFPTRKIILFGVIAFSLVMLYRILVKGVI